MPFLMFFRSRFRTMFVLLRCAVEGAEGRRRMWQRCEKTSDCLDDEGMFVAMKRVVVFTGTTV